VLLALAVVAPARAQAPLVIWSSLPFDGAGAADARDVRDAEALALAEAGGAAGGRRVVLRSRNDATRQARAWDPGKVAGNARRAAQDEVLGRYSIDAQGDTTLSTYGVYASRGGLPRFAAVVDSAG
jgi:hypothetical protein